MFNYYFEFNEDNRDLLFVNAVLENLKYGIISLDAMFAGNITRDFYNDRYTFYFFHMQSVLTAQGNIWNVLRNNFYEKNRNISQARILAMREKLGIDINNYPLVGNKKFRNTNEHFDERYFQFQNGIGDYNILSQDTPTDIKNQILRTPHLRTIDIVNWTYITYDEKQNQIVLNLRSLRDEMYDMFFAISSNERIHLKCIDNPRHKILD